MEHEKFIDIESKLAHQEHTISELNDALSSQQMQISKLEHQVVTLIDRVRSLSESAPAGGTDDEPPPHY